MDKKQPVKQFDINQASPSKTKTPLAAKVKKGALVFTTLPLRLVVPRGVGFRTHPLKRKELAEVCPSCLSFNLVYQNKRWSCPSCDYSITANTDDLQALRQYIREHGHSVERHVEDDRVERMIMKRVFAARIVAMMCWLVFIFNVVFLIKGMLLTLVAGLSLLFLLLSIVASYGYRAWQLATGKLYPVDGKAQFKHYVFNNLWIKNPLNN